MCHFVRATQRDLANFSKEFGGLDMLNRTVTKCGENVRSQPSENVISVANRPALCSVGDIGAGDRLERIFRFKLDTPFFSFAFCRGVTPVADNLSRVVALFAGFPKRHFGIGTESQKPLFSTDSIFEPPEFGTGGAFRAGQIDEQKQTLLIGKLVGFLSRLGLADGGIF